MASQPAPRPWFRLASMVLPAPPPAPARPPAPPPPVPQQTFRPPPVAPPQQTQPPPPPLPMTPASLSSPVASPPFPAAPPRASGPSSPILRVVSPDPASSPAAASPAGTRTPKSPATTGSGNGIAPPPSRSRTRSPIATPAPPLSPSPLIKTSSSPNYSLPPSPKEKASVPTSPMVTTPAFKSVPSSPVPPPPSPVPTSSSPIPTVKDRALSPAKIVQPLAETPPQSPKVKSFVRPPSPLVLPPAQLKPDSDLLEPIPTEAEQKTVLMQETDEKPKTSNGHQQQRYHDEGDHHAHNNAHSGKQRELKQERAAPGTHKNNRDSSHELGFWAVTLAGENKGAIMELSPPNSRNSLKEKGSSTRAWIHGQKSRNNYHSHINDREEAGSSKMKLDEKMVKARESAAPPPMDAFINSNVQIVNNSILYNCSCTHNNPGVHLSVSRTRNNCGVHSKSNAHG